MPLLMFTAGTLPPASYTHLIYHGPLCIYWLIMIGPAGGGSLAFMYWSLPPLLSLRNTFSNSYKITSDAGNIQLLGEKNSVCDGKKV